MAKASTNDTAGNAETTPAMTVSQRLDALEKKIAELERRLDHITI